METRNTNNAHAGMNIKRSDSGGKSHLVKKGYSLILTL